MSEQQNNMTVWQRLSQTFGPNSQLNQNYPTFKFDKKELLRTKSKEEYEKEKLQAQQTFYLTNQWAKVENNLYNICKINNKQILEFLKLPCSHIIKRISKHQSHP